MVASNEDQSKPESRHNKEMNWKRSEFRIKRKRNSERPVNLVTTERVIIDYNIWKRLLLRTKNQSETGIRNLEKYEESGI